MKISQTSVLHDNDSDVKHTLPTRGYLAFPPGTPVKSPSLLHHIIQQERLETLKPSSSPASSSPSTTQHNQTRPPPPPSPAPSPSSRSPPTPGSHSESKYASESLKGEKHWVRSGGFLRTPAGRRDPVRTAYVRRLVDEEDREAEVRRRWDGYEERWADLISRVGREGEVFRWEDLPWPILPSTTTTITGAKSSSFGSPFASNQHHLHHQIPTTIKSPSELTKQSISSFLFESLSLPENVANKVTRKDRIRATLLRWHPDKLGGVLARVPEGSGDGDGGSEGGEGGERVKVKEGIERVVMALMALGDEEKCAEKA
ncbi:hypothetical protein BD410DRAFT_795863 [Rickenella mellea]|uniref:J domain-containing protein n=1 Tax=Rickenella mellea TaxID=50990 RepID=A0A4Y7PL23_9AGAM|nr:hypothetical protein BD410DRAFT_795863 [Rickenella mellea]